MIFDCEVYLLKTPVAGKIYGIPEIEAIMDEAGIVKAVVMPDVVQRPPNRVLAEKVNDNPRFIPCALINPQYGQEAVDELETAVKEWGVRGLKLMPPKHGYPIISKIVHPLMAKSAELEIPVSIHSMGGWGHPLSIASLARDFPDVPVIMDHMGYRYWVADAIAGARQTPNLYLATTAVMEPHFIHLAIEEIGVDRIVFGSNAPFVIPSMQVEVVKQLGLSPDEEERIFYSTLARLYKIE